MFSRTGYSIESYFDFDFCLWGRSLAEELAVNLLGEFKWMQNCSVIWSAIT